MRVVVGGVLGVVLGVIGCGDAGSAGPTLARVGVSGLTQNYAATDAAWRDLMDRAEASGATFVHLQAPPWPEGEPTRGDFDLRAFDGFFRLRGEYALEYTLDIPTPLGLGSQAVPPDVEFTSYGDPALEARYFEYVTHLIETFDGARHVILHTETIGPVFGNDPEDPEFVALCGLVGRTADHVRAARPGVQVGVYGTLAESAAVLECLNRRTDFFGVSTLLDRGDADPEATFTRIRELAGGRPIAICEAGIPTAGRVGGSEARQVAYVDALFDLREALGEQLLFVSYYQVFDEDPSVTRMYAPVLFPDWDDETLEDFVQWISSLGLHRVDHGPKPAFARFVERARDGQ
jgi:hypothetical protein